MQEVNNKLENDFNEDIDIREVFYALHQGRRIIAYVTGFITLLGIIYSLQLPNVYQSEALLAPIEESSSLMSGAVREFAGLAGLAGINLPGNNTSSNSKKAKELMKSLSFFENYLMPKIYLPNLMAVKSWDYKNNRIIYDESIFNKKTNSWVSDFSDPKQSSPSAQESFSIFKEKHFNMQEDKDTGHIILSIEHQSPLVAKQWVEIIVNEVNSFYRERDKAQSEKAVIYLKKQMTTASLSEVRLVTASLAQKEIQKLTLIEANEDYVFEYIYPPSIMEEKAGPSRALICILFVFLGLILSSIYVLIKFYMNSPKAS